MASGWVRTANLAADAQAQVRSRRHRGHGGFDDLGGVGGVLVEDGDDLLDGDGVVAFAPAVVVGDHGDGGVADLGFAG